MISLALAGILSIFADASEPAMPTVRSVALCDHRFEYRTWRPSRPGRFLLTPFGGRQTCLAVLASDGTVVFQRRFTQPKFSGEFPVLMLTDFKRLGTEPLFGYFMQQAIGATENLTTFHFLDARFRDVFPRAIPDAPELLNTHDVQVSSRGTYFFLFNRPRYLPSGPVLDAELQEWGPEGPRGFRWNSQQTAELAPDESSGPNYLHMNSLELDGDDGLLVSFLARSEVVRLGYPDGGLRWRLSARTWAFPNDPLHGFQWQHSARRLPNGNLLLYDNGTRERGGISRAVEYRLDERRKVAELVWEYRNRDGNPFRERLGSVQRLSNGNTLIGWGNPPVGAPDAKPGTVAPLFTEVDPQGHEVRELRGPLFRSYRISFEEEGAP